MQYIIGALPKHATVVCNKLKVITLKLHKISASIIFIKKLIFKKLTTKFAIVNRKFINEQDRFFAQDNISKGNLDKHGTDLHKLIIGYNHLLEKLKSLPGNTLLKIDLKHIQLIQ